MAKRIALCIVLSLALVGAASAREGFGFTKRATEFNRTIPPAVNVSGNKVNVTASSRTRFSEKAEALRKLTEEELTKGNKFQVGTPADVNVVIELDRLEVSSRSENKVDYDNEKYKDKDGKTQYRKVAKTVTETVVTGNIAGGYKITDSHAGLFDSGVQLRETLRLFDDEDRAGVAGWLPDSRRAENCGPHRADHTQVTRSSAEGELRGIRPAGGKRSLGSLSAGCRSSPRNVRSFSGCLSAIRPWDR